MLPPMSPATTKRGFGFLLAVFAMYQLADVSLAVPRQYPPGGRIDWSQNTPSNNALKIPSPTIVRSSKDCFGNCGAGCGDWTLFGAAGRCGSPQQYWRLELLSPPRHVRRGQDEECVHGQREVRDVDIYHARGRWTYYGWWNVACEQHDKLCNKGLVGCVVWSWCRGFSLRVNWRYEDSSVVGYRYSNFRVRGTCGEGNDPV